MDRKSPNFLFIQADQLPSHMLPIYGHPVVKAPHLQQLADASVVFDNAYCNFPLCAPSRFSMLSGLLGSRIGAYDNGAEFPAAVPTFVHALRLMGYQTCLSGKMHFIGPDQLHGFEERLTTDIYPADFLWTADWSPRERQSTAEMGVVLNAGPCRRSVQVDFDDEATFHAVRKLYDIARDPMARPFFLLVSFTHPHDPFETPWPYWNRYGDDEIDSPRVPTTPDDQRDPHSRRLAKHFGIDDAGIDEETVRNCRHAYYGSISYVDDKVGELLTALKGCGLAENTVVVFTADHGEFMGERGLWFKRSFFEPSVRVPLVVRAPGLFAPRRVAQNVSLVDLFPTLCELGGEAVPDLAKPLDGHSMTDLMAGSTTGWPDTVLSEILCECTTAPAFMIKRGAWKYIACESDPPQLYDLSRDPDELTNLAGCPETAEMEDIFARLVADSWDSAAILESVQLSQRRRLLVNQALSTGQPTSWDYQPMLDASQAYYRGRGAADAMELIARGLAYGIIEEAAGEVRYRGRKIGNTRAAAASFLKSELEIANALERQIREAAGHL